MKVTKFNLQLFNDGSDGASASTGSTDLNVSGADEKTALKDQVAAGQNGDVTTSSPEDDAKAFDDLIKKGGKYAKQFQEKSQAIINKRFAHTKELESKLDSQKNVIDLISQRYNVTSDNVEDLIKAIEEDDSFYEKAAFEKGMDVNTYKEMARLERENAKFKAEMKANEEKLAADNIYAKWEAEGEALATKYGINDFSLQVEAQNPDFINLLQSGVDFETAYKVMHFDEMLGGGMAATADNVAQKMAQSIASRQSRPSENGTSSSSGQAFTVDVNSLSDEQIKEYVNRSARGERISF